MITYFPESCRYGRNFDDERNVYFEWDPKTHHNSALNAEVYETRNENYRSKIQKRMLYPESLHSYPNFQMYTPESQTIAPLALKPGARAPVLQYAHPELGVQPAKILKKEKRRPDNFPENQNSFTEQRHKKKYVLNNRNIVDSYTLKNYYPNQHFYGLKQPNDQPFWTKITENLRNQFSTGVERMSQLTRPVFHPLVEATQKLSQNLGLTKGMEAQDKIGTVATGSSILIPALGLVASGAALGIGAVAVGRYLDVDVLKRSQGLGADQNENDESEYQRALAAIYPRDFYGAEAEDSRQSKLYETSPKNLHLVQDSKIDDAKNDSSENDQSRSREVEDDVFMILEEIENSEWIENRQSKQAIDKASYFETKRIKRSIDAPFKVHFDNTELLPSKNRVRNDHGIISVLDNDFQDDRVSDNHVERDEPPIDDLLQVETILVEPSRHPEGFRTRNRRSTYGDRELDDALQNLENAAISEAAHIAGDWNNTPCAKRIFCDAMIQKGQDASILMEKKMESLLGL